MISNGVICILCDGACTLISLHTEKQYRCKGYATYILNQIRQYCIKKHITEIVLDDCTDNFGSADNIYLKFGFKYIEKDHPEMILNL